MNKPLVSIRLMTFNHAEYIRQAMDSILMQRIDFPLEVVIGDDFSTDGTLDIIRQYRSTDKISICILDRKKGDKYWETRQRRGRLYNFENIIANCHGKYIALLDGDDYWCDPLKLQKQFNYLEEHLNVGMVYTDHFIYNEDKGTTIEIHEEGNEKGECIFHALLLKNNIPTPTVMVRSELIKNAITDLNTNLKIHKIMDYPLWLNISLNTKIGHIPELTSVYRLQENTASRPGTLEEKYDYIKNIYDIRMKICELYNCDNDTIKRIQVNYHRKYLYLAFQYQDKNRAKEAINNLKSINRFLTLRDRMKYIGSINKIFNKLIKSGEIY